MDKETMDSLKIDLVTYASETGEMRAYLAMPKGGKKLPAVLVIHAIKGLDAHIEDVARSVAVEGFIALAPDALSPQGGTPKDPEQTAALIKALDRQEAIKNYLAAVKYLKTHPMSTGKVGVIGFCWGGGMANELAVNSTDLSAVVPYYGMQPVLEDVPKIKTPLLLHYAGIDEQFNKGIPAFEAALKNAGIDYQLYMYEGTKHAFNNDTNPERYDKEAAKLAWKRTISFLKERLKA